MIDSIRNIRNKYRPKKVKYLLIGESPPKCDNDNFRFFYNPPLEHYDYLFKSVMNVVFLSSMKNYHKGNKGKFLEKFQKQIQNNLKTDKKFSSISVM